MTNLEDLSSLPIIEPEIFKEYQVSKVKSEINTKDSPKLELK